MAPSPFQPFRRSRRLRIAYWLYQLLFHLGLPLVLGLILVRSIREPLYRARLGERFGLGRAPAPGSVWIFAASLGETRAASPLIRALLANGQTVHLTHSSPAGLCEGMRLFENAIAAGRLRSEYVPLDLFWTLRRALVRSKPIAGLVVESELWPAMLTEAAHLQLPMFQINGNLLEKSLQRDLRRFDGLRLELFQGYQGVLTKSKQHESHYQRAGIASDRIHMVGELKFDQWINPALPKQGIAARNGLKPGQACFLIASSVEGEEELLLPLVKSLCTLPNAPLVLWVPRSPQRFSAVHAALKSEGLHVARRSDVFNAQLNGTMAADVQVLVGDSLGEMDFYYAMADLVFVGASLIDHGGHNIIEPLAQGKPVLMGPSIFGIAYPAHDAMQAGAFESLPNPKALQARAMVLMQDKTALAELTNKATYFCADHKGAAKNSLAVLLPYLNKPGLTLRPAEKADADSLWRWRNDPQARAMSGSSEDISLTDHTAWYADILPHPDRQILIGQNSGTAIGMVRFDHAADGQNTIVSITLSPEARGQGFGQTLLAQALAICPFPTMSFLARIHPDNISSIALFTGIGFVPTQTGDFHSYTLQIRSKP